MENESSNVALSKLNTALSIFENAAIFEHVQRVAKVFTKSTLVPKPYQGDAGIPNVIIALEIASRINMSPFMVMQNLDVIVGRPSWSSKFLIAALNTCGRFEPLRFKVEGEGDKRSCIAWTKDKTGNVLEGPSVSIEMAKKEGWMDKNGSKWKTMPDLMLRYRAASFFSRLYAPEIGMGMHTTEEIIDMGDGNTITVPNAKIPNFDNIPDPQQDADDANIISEGHELKEPENITVQSAAIVDNETKKEEPKKEESKKEAPAKEQPKQDCPFDLSDPTTEENPKYHVWAIQNFKGNVQEWNKFKKERVKTWQQFGGAEYQAIEDAINKLENSLPSNKK
jgi:hypothetical protein